MDRGDLSDAEWALIAPLLPSERGRWARPAGDTRRSLNGMLHVLQVRCPWRDLPHRYGTWTSAYLRFRPWDAPGVWAGIPQTLVDLGLTDAWQHLPDRPTAPG